MESPLRNRVSPLRSLSFRIGFRGTILITFAFLFILFGLSRIGIDDKVEGQFHSDIPWQVRVCYWLLAGVIALIAAFRKRGNSEWGGSSDWWGFVALMLPLGITALSLALARSPSAFVWCAFIVIVITCNIWPEPTRRPKSCASCKVAPLSISDSDLSVLKVLIEGSEASEKERKTEGTT